jgi:hypothetical protein
MNHLTAVAADAQTINMAEREELERDGGVQSAGGGKSEAAEGGPGEGDVLRELGTLRERMTVMHEHLNFISTVCVSRLPAHLHAHTCSRAHTHTHEHEHMHTHTHCHSLYLSLSGGIANRASTGATAYRCPIRCFFI